MRQVIFLIAFLDSILYTRIDSAIYAADQVILTQSEPARFFKFLDAGSRPDFYCLLSEKSYRFQTKTVIVRNQLAPAVRIL